MDYCYVTKMASLMLIAAVSTEIYAESVAVQLPDQKNNAATTSANSSTTATIPTSGNAPSNALPTSPSSTTTQKNVPTSQATNKTTSSTHSADSVIVSDIQASIATNNITAMSNVDVSSKDGVVKLIGSVVSMNEAGILIEISESVAGVKEVDTSKLIVGSNQKIPTDNIITAKVKGSFIREKMFNNKDIIKPLNVKTANGVVTLTGTVANQEQVDKAVKLTKSISDVYKVDSKIIVMEENKK